MAKRTRRKIYSPSTKYKMSIAHKGSKNGMYNKHHSEETKKKISQKLKEYWKHIVIEQHFAINTGLSVAILI